MELFSSAALAAGALPGILAMVAGIAFLIFIHELGHWLIARMFGFKTPIFSIGFGKREHSLVLGTFWQTEFRLSPIPLGGYVSIPELQDESAALESAQQPGRDLPKFKVFPVWKRISVAVAGVVMNIIFAVFAIAALFTFIGKPSIEVNSTSIANLSTQITIGRDAGLLVGDKFISVDGRAVKTPSDLIAALRGHRGKSVELVVSRLGENITVTITPNQDGQTGIDVAADAVRKYTPIGAVQALREGATTSATTMIDMFRGIGMMLGQVEPPPNLPSGATDVHGIVGIVSIGQQAFDEGAFAFVWLLSMISLNLAIMNILPFPPLDGGHVLFYSIEGIFGKPLPVGIRTKLTQIFFLLFVLLMFYGLFNDIFNPIRLG
ncbi:MAG: site-2 protease family protein [Candidatus Melainabacteria bacterium]|jgi:regulator of sigma E protease|nr:site-2 protease family protein [Candidatus Melainabacteria bacterium]